MAMRISRRAYCPAAICASGAERPGSAPIGERSEGEDDRGPEDPRPAARLQGEPPRPLEPHRADRPGRRRRCPAHMSNAPPTPIMIRAEGTASALPRDPPLLLRRTEADEDDRRCEGGDGAGELEVALVGPDAPSSATATPSPAVSIRTPGTARRHRCRRVRRRRIEPPTKATVTPRSAAIRSSRAAISTPGHRRTRRRLRSDSIRATPVPSGRARSAA